MKKIAQLKKESPTLTLSQPSINVLKGGKDKRSGRTTGQPVPNNPSERAQEVLTEIFETKLALLFQ